MSGKYPIKKRNKLLLKYGFSLEVIEGRVVLIKRFADGFIDVGTKDHKFRWFVKLASTDGPVEVSSIQFDNFDEAVAHAINFVANIESEAKHDI